MPGATDKVILMCIPATLIDPVTANPEAIAIRNRIVRVDEEWREYVLAMEMKRLKAISAEGRAKQQLRRMGELTKWARLVG
jgi:hypothetical protein